MNQIKEIYHRLTSTYATYQGEILVAAGMTAGVAGMLANDTDTIFYAGVLMQEGANLQLPKSGELEDILAA